MKENIFFIKKINKFIFHKNLLNVKKFYILTISGGQDSICLLFFFYIIKKQFQIKILILYCNHLWQYENFNQSNQLIQICFLFQINFFQILPNIFLFTEKDARIWRLKNFYRFCFFFTSHFIVTGHSATDRIETFFLNLLRGSGFNGLKTFKEKKKLFFKQNLFSKNNFFIFEKKKKLFFKSKKRMRTKNKKFLNKIFKIETHKIQKFYILRPFFLITRGELKTFIRNLVLPVFPDKTNFKTTYKRNRLRQQLFPLLKYFFNKQIDFNLIKLIDLISKNQDLFRKEYGILYKKIFFNHKKIYSINIYLFKKISNEKKNQFIFIFFFKELNYSVDFLFLINFIDFINKIKERKTFFFKFFLIPKIGFMGVYKNQLYIIKK